MKLFVLANAVLAGTADLQAIRDKYEGAMVTAFSGEQATAIKEIISHIAQDMVDNLSNPDVLRTIVDNFRALVPDDVLEGAIGKDDQLLEKRDDDDKYDPDYNHDKGLDHKSVADKDLTDDEFYNLWMGQYDVWWNMWNCCGTCPMGS